MDDDDEKNEAEESKPQRAPGSSPYPRKRVSCNNSFPFWNHKKRSLFFPSWKGNSAVETSINITPTLKLIIRSSLFHVLRYELWKIRELKRIKRDKEDRLREVLDLWIVGSSILGLFGPLCCSHFWFLQWLFVHIYIYTHTFSGSPRGIYLVLFHKTWSSDSNSTYSLITFLKDRFKFHGKLYLNYLCQAVFCWWRFLYCQERLTRQKEIEFVLKSMAQSELNAAGLTRKEQTLYCNCLAWFQDCILNDKKEEKFVYSL